MEKLLNVANIWDGEVECDLIKGLPHRGGESCEAIESFQRGEGAGPPGVVFEMIKTMHDKGV